jgi:hypothetical protein
VQASATNGVDVRLAADQEHGMTGPRQHAAVVATDRAGTHYCYLHRVAHSILFLLIGGAKISIRSPKLPISSRRIKASIN